MSMPMLAFDVGARDLGRRVSRVSLCHVRKFVGCHAVQ